MDTLREHGTRWGLACEAGQIETLEAYVALLLEHNQHTNLIGPFDAAQIERALFLDSAAAASVVPQVEGGARVVDMGTGAGLPGIPMAVLRPDVRVTLVEPRKKRAAFLRVAVEALGLTNAEVIDARVQSLHKRCERGTFDVAVSKAFEPPPRWVVTASAWIKPGGSILCLTRQSTPEEIADVVAAQRLELAQVLPVGLDDRVVVRYTTAR